MRGNITRRGKESWRVKFEAGERDPTTGKRLTRFITVRGKRKDAEAALTKALSEIDGGSFVDPSKFTFKEFLDRWERDFAAVRHSPKTRERETQLLDHARRRLGSVELQKLRPADLAQLYATLQREGRGPEDSASPRARSRTSTASFAKPSTTPSFGGFYL